MDMETTWDSMGFSMDIFARSEERCVYNFFAIVLYNYLIHTHMCSLKLSICIRCSRKAQGA